MAEQVAEIFTEVIVAPEYEDGALEALTKKKNIRVLRAHQGPSAVVETKQIDGGALLQVTDRVQADGDNPASWTLATGDALSPGELDELAFAWKACRAVKSNAILLAKDGASVGVGMGQPRRLLQAGRGARGRGAGARLLRRVGRVLPVPGRAADPDRRRCEGDRPARRFHP
jgi:phosphoribosylaminoimidazolecarboxamide formyltransferase/IMP cyclohydrolase